MKSIQPRDNSSLIEFDGTFLRKNGKYAVIASKICSDDDATFDCLKEIYNLPIIAQTWKNLHFGCIFMLIGDQKTWKTESPFRDAYEELLTISDVMLIFVPDAELGDRFRHIHFEILLPYFVTNYLPQILDLDGIYF